MQVRGRYLVFAWTAVFLAAVGAIVFRTKAGFATRTRVDEIESHMKALDAVRGDLEADLATLKSRAHLAQKAAALGLRFTSDSDVHLIPVPVGH